MGNGINQSSWTELGSLADGDALESHDAHYVR